MLEIGAPDTVLAAWLRARRDAPGGETLVAGRRDRAQLTRLAKEAGLSVRVTVLEPPATAWPSSLVARLLATLAPSDVRQRQGWADAIVRRLQQGLPADGPPDRDALHLVARLLGPGASAGIYRYAEPPPGYVTAVYGRFLLAEAPAVWHRMLAAGRTGVALLPAHPDEPVVETWWREWEAAGGIVHCHPWPDATDLEPDAVWPGNGDPDTTLIVTADRDRAATVRYRLAVRGLAAPPGLDHPGAAWLQAWQAAERAADPLDVLLWGGAGLTDPGVRRTVVEAGARPERWPAPLAEAQRRLRDAREQLLDAATWAEVGRALRVFSQAAGVSSPFPEEGWEIWDALGAPVRPLVPIEWVGSRPDLEDAPGPAVEAVADVTGIPYATVVLWNPDEWLPRWTGETRRFVTRLGTRVMVAGDSWPLPAPVARARLLQAAAGRFDPGSVPVPDTVTRFEQFGRCPLQYAWQALGVPEWPEMGPEPPARQVGTWMHRALERLLAGPLPADDRLAERVRGALDEVVAADPPPVTVLPETLAGTLEAMTTDLTWLLLLRPASGSVDTEAAFRLVVDDGIMVRGRVDRVERLPDGRLLAVDYKTGALPRGDGPSPTELQLVVYAAAAAARHGVPLSDVEAAYWGITRTNAFGERRLAAPVEARWAEARAILAGIRERVRDGACYPYPAADACRRCAYRMACPPDIERRARAARAPDDPFVALWARRDDTDEEEPGHEPR